MASRKLVAARRDGIKPLSYYSWAKEFIEVRKERLVRDSLREPPNRRYRHCGERRSSRVRCRFSGRFGPRCKVMAAIPPTASAILPRASLPIPKVIM